MKQKTKEITLKQSELEKMQKNCFKFGKRSLYLPRVIKQKIAEELK